MVRVICLATVLLLAMACSNKEQKNRQETGDAGSYGYRYNNSSSGGGGGISSQLKEGYRLELCPDAYDDGYIDGESATEEDRLARRPGMQSGGDDDEEDDDYEDGYDDGYEEW